MVKKMKTKTNVKAMALVLLAISIPCCLLYYKTTSMQTVLPEGHRAYEWEWTVKAGGMVVPLTSTVGKELAKLNAEIQKQVQEKLGAEVDEQGNPVQIISISDVEKVDLKTRYTGGYVTHVRIESYTAKVTTRFHGHFAPATGMAVVSVSLAVLAIIHKCAPWIIAGIILILGLEYIKQILSIARDITTDYVVEEIYAVDEEGNLILDDQGNPTVVGRRTYRKSRIEQIMPWIFGIVAATGISIVLYFALRAFAPRRGKRR